ncbi:MAG: hypothetical protein IPK03_06205 [Bacteroidetes bacterium]|nr:hypothetical protein [Bacteroidota bacterium]
MDVKESHKLLAKIEKSSDDIYILLDTKILWLQNYLIDYTEKLDYELGFLHAYAKKIVYFIEQHDVNQAARQRAKKWVEYVVQLMKCNNSAAFDKFLLKLEEDVDFLKRHWLKRIVEMRMELLRKGEKKR